MGADFVNPEMSTPVYVARSTRVAARRLGDETMIMSGRDSSLFTLNPTASVIWEAADGITPLSQIVEERICMEFDTEPGAAIRDARELVKGLAEAGILVTSDAPIPAPEVK